MGSKNSCCSSAYAASTLGGSPGRCFLKSSISAPFFVFVFSGSFSIVLRMYAEPAEEVEQLLVEALDVLVRLLDVRVRLRVVGHRAQQDRDRKLALAVDPDEDLALLVDLELEPRTARRHEVRREHLLLAVLRLHHVGAGGADELRHDDALGAVDDERAALGHPREVAHEDRLLADLARLLVDEGDGDRQRARVREVLLTALGDRCRRLVEDEFAELHGKIAGVVLDRGDVVDGLPEPPLLGVDQPGERAPLDIDEVGNFEGLVQTRESTARPEGVYARHGRRLLVGSEADDMGRGSREKNANDQDSTARRAPRPGARQHSRTPPRPRVCGAEARTWAAATIG